MASFKTLLLAGAFAAGCLAASAAQAGTIYATGFEAPTFTPGPIAGQGGWQTFSNSGQPNLAQVESGVAQSGAQALVVDGAAGAQTGSYYTLNLPSPGKVDMSGDIMITTAGSAASWQFAAIGPGLVGFVGGIDIDGSGNVAAISGAFPSLGALSFDNWHHVDLLLDFTSQTYGVKLDGVAVGSGLAFCGSNAGCTGAPVNTLGVGIFDTFGGAAPTAPHPGYLDNFSVASVPEPATWALMIGGFGLAGASLRRRRAAA